MTTIEGTEPDDNDAIVEGEDVLVFVSAVLDGELTQESTVNHDTGATRHIFRSQELFHDYSILETHVNGLKEHTFSLSNVLHIPTAHCNLISGSRIDRKGVKTTTGDGKITYTNSSNVPFAQGSIIRDLYQMNVVAVKAQKTSSTSIHSPSVMAALMPDVTTLFGTGPKSESEVRQGFSPSDGPHRR